MRYFFNKAVAVVMLVILSVLAAFRGLIELLTLPDNVMSAAGNATALLEVLAKAPWYVPWFLVAAAFGWVMYLTRHSPEVSAADGTVPVPALPAPDGAPLLIAKPPAKYSRMERDRIFAELHDLRAILVNQRTEIGGPVNDVANLFFWPAGDLTLAYKSIEDAQLVDRIARQHREALSAFYTQSPFSNMWSEVIGKYRGELEALAEASRAIAKDVEELKAHNVNAVVMKVATTARCGIFISVMQSIFQHQDKIIRQLDQMREELTDDERLSA